MKIENTYIVILSLVLGTMYLPTIANSISIIGLVTFWIWTTLKTKRIRRINYIRIGILSLPFISLLIGMIYSESKTDGIRVLETSLPFIVFPMIFGTIKPLSRNSIDKVLKTFVYFTAIIAIYCFFRASYISIINQNFYEEYSIFNYKHWYFLYDTLAGYVNFHPTYLSLLVSTSLFIQVIIFYNKLKYSTKWKAIFLLSLLFDVLLMSRIVLIGSLFILTFLIVRRLSLTKFRIAFVLITIIGFTTFFYTTDGIVDRFSRFDSIGYNFSNRSHTQWNGVSLRLAKWQCAIETIKGHPLIGWGTGDGYNELQNTYLAHDFIYAFDQGYNAHNLFLTILLKIGIIGLLMYIIYFVLPMTWSQSYSSNQYALHISIFILFLFTFLVESTLVRNKGVVLFSFFHSLISLHSFNHK